MKFATDPAVAMTQQLSPKPKRPRTQDAGAAMALTCHSRAVRIATWNVNAIRPRMPRFVDWLETRRPDVVCLQETKLDDLGFDGLIAGEAKRLGYEWAHNGQGQWNGVAVLSRVGLEDVQVGFPGDPGFPEPDIIEARAVSAVCSGIRVTSVYVPNGRTIDDPHYSYKLAWLDALRADLSTVDGDQVVCGDYNIAPTDADVFNPDAFAGHTHVTQPERDALASIEALGLRDVVRERWPDDQVFSYWDYRAGMFHQNHGMRIDLVLATAPVADRVAAAWIDRLARKGTGPSDHAPVMVDLDTAPDGDIGPMVPPPSRPTSGRGRRLPQSR